MMLYFLGIKKYSDVNEENNDLGAMNPGELCGLLDALMGDKEAQSELIKVRNHEELCRKLKALEHDSPSKKKSLGIATKCSNIFWKNDEASSDRISIVKKAMAAKRKALEDKACLLSNSQGDAHDPLNVPNIFKDNEDENNDGVKLTDDQKCILDAVAKKMQSGEQILFLAHGAAGAGKSTVMQKVKDIIDASGKKVIVVCPTGIAATLIDGGTTFHRTFKVNTKDATPEMIRDIFTTDVELIIVDEVSMISSKFIVMMDHKLRQIYDPEKCLEERT